MQFMTKRALGDLAVLIVNKTGRMDYFILPVLLTIITGFSMFFSFLFFLSAGKRMNYYYRLW
ncbi:hypothetical protein DDI_3476 [Dickeya dianthicola RNS04.9]|nr:hypothetical protein DDI_3476 [Dickeya dianthicola RNS04.9]